MCFLRAGDLLLAQVLKRYNRLTNGHAAGAAEIYRGEAYSVQGRFEESDIQAYQAAFLSEQAQNASATYGAALLLPAEALAITGGDVRPVYMSAATGCPTSSCAISAITSWSWRPV